MSQDQYSQLKEGLLGTTTYFKHGRLPQGRFIRLLELLPSTGNADRLSCKLKEFNFDGAPAYEPISYAWGNANDKEEIICNGQLFLITTSLSNGLRRMRLKNQSRILWADGICIDQTNNEEKSHQVAFMSNIYRRGARTLVWLGEDDHSCLDGESGCIRTVFEMIEKTSAHYSSEYDKITQAPGSDLVQILAKIEPPEYRSAVSRGGSSKAWACVGDFYRRPWFSRCWVLIEVGVSSRAQVICGQEKIAWSDVALMINILGASTLLTCNPRPAVGALAEVFSLVWASTTSQDSWIAEKALLHQMARKDVNYYNSNSTYLLNVLDTARKFRATDARDHVFAFLGHPALQSLMEPNYTMSTEAMHIGLAKQLFDSTGSLDVLCFVKNRDEDIKSLSLPSWVPQWHEHNGNYGTVHSNWKVLTSNDKEQIFGIEGSSLIMTGLIFDQVDQCSELLNGTEVSLPQSDSNIETLWRLYQKTNSHPQTSLEAFIWTLVDGGYSNSRAIYKDFLAFCEIYSTREFSGGVEHNEILQVVADKPSPISPSEARFRHMIQDRLNNRRFFTMKSNPVCGLGPRLLQRGDILAAAFGCSMPLVLRATDQQERYKFVGVCYVDWLVCDDMDNFVMRDLRNGKLKKESIVLV